MGKENTSGNNGISYIFRRFYANRIANFILIHINKTGGSSIEKALGLPQQYHLTALEIKNKIRDKRWNKKFKFAFVRNPWDKVVSHYSYRYKRNVNNMKDDNIDFKKWVKLTYRDKNPKYYHNPKMYAPQMDWICNEKGEIIIDFVGRFEKLNDDFQKVCKIIRKNKELPHLRKSSHKHYSEYYDEETKKIIEKIFEKDIKEFGYKF
jgi:hypothetical protein